MPAHVHRAGCSWGSSTPVGAWASVGEERVDKNRQISAGIGKAEENQWMSFTKEGPGTTGGLCLPFSKEQMEKQYSNVKETRVAQAQRNKEGQRACSLFPKHKVNGSLPILERFI